MPDLLKIALTTFGSALAAIGIPTAIFLVWMPREFDDLETSIESNASDIAAVKADTEKIIKSNEEVVARLTETGKSAEDSLVMVGYLAAELDSKKNVLRQILETKFSEDLVVTWDKAGKLGYLKGAMVNGEEYIFLDLKDVQNLSRADFDLLTTASEKNGFEFEIWDSSQFPGAHFEY